MGPRVSVDRSLAISYLGLRRAIGLIGFGMPLIVEIGARISTGKFLDSVSASYYTVMRDVFVGSLAAIGTFLLFHVDTDRLDRILARIAGLAAVAIGLLPMDRVYEAGEPSLENVDLQHLYQVCAQGICVNGPRGYHMYAVGTFFAIITYMVLFRFTKVADPGRITAQKRTRNKLYVVFGVVMLASFVAIGLIKFYGAKKRIYVPETLSILAFSSAWLVKGQTVLKDRPSL